ncbi:MAG: hypothetical protein PHS74_00595 [Lachnospiraceae bacterium]|nr:hypothetical protein [Lachnospiraceae bacterium]
MGKLSILEMGQQIHEAVNEADMILIGLGEEFALQKEDYLSAEGYDEVENEVGKNPELEWELPWFKTVVADQKLVSVKNTAYGNLLSLIKDKNYFVVTTCIDDYIRKWDFKKITAPCGTHRKLQCDGNCMGNLHDFPAKESIVFKKALSKEIKMQDIVQKYCMDCGKPLVFNTVFGEQYNEQGYMDSWQEYTKWLQFTMNRKVCILELGVGLQFPSVIRWPFEKLAFYNKKATFFRIHEKLFQLPENIADKGTCLQENACEFMAKGFV